MLKMKPVISIVCVCIFSFLGGILGSIIKDNLSYANQNGSLNFELDLTPAEIEGIPIEIYRKIEKLEKRLDFFENQNQNEIKSMRVKDLYVKRIWLKNKHNNIIMVFSENNECNPMINYYTKEKPCEPIMKNSEFLLDESNMPIFNTAKLQINKNGMIIRDVDRDIRLYMGVNNLEPLIDFFYRGKKRLSLGTNSLMYKKTGKKEEIEGSIFSYNNEGYVMGSIPRNY